MAINASPLAQSQPQSAKVTGSASEQDSQSGTGSEQESQFLELMQNLAGIKGAGKNGQTSGAPANRHGDGQADADGQQAQAGKAADTAQADAAVTTPTPSGAEDTNVTADLAALLESGSGKASDADRKQVDAGGSKADGDSVSQTTANLLSGILARMNAGAAPDAGQTSIRMANTAQTAGQPGQQANGTSSQSAAKGISDLFAEFSIEPETVGEGRLTAGDKGKSGADIASIKVIRQETHFAPTMRLSPIQQIGDSIVESLKAEAGRPLQDAQGFSIKPEGHSVKTLEIQLTPIELGTVKVSMKIVGDRVEISMTASNPDTVEILKQDRQLLDKMLQSTGYKADAITIQAANDRTVQQPAANQNSSSQFSGQDQSAGNGAFQGTMQQGGGQNRQSSEQQPETGFVPSDDSLRSTDHETGINTRHDSGVYL